MALDKSRVQASQLLEWQVDLARSHSSIAEQMWNKLDTSYPDHKNAAIAVLACLTDGTTIMQYEQRGRADQQFDPHNESTCCSVVAQQVGDVRKIWRETGRYKANDKCVAEGEILWIAFACVLNKKENGPDADVAHNIVLFGLGLNQKDNQSNE